MALTLLEAAKLHTGDVYKQGVIEQFAMSSGVLRHLPIQNISGGSLSYVRENSLPATGFRGVNEGYVEGIGTYDNLSEKLALFGTTIRVDKAIVAFQGEDQRAMQEAMAIKALSLSWERVFFKGVQESNPQEFNGIQMRLTGNQLISAGKTSGGDPLTLSKLDELIDQVSTPTHILMNAKMRRLLTQANRNSGISGFLSNDRNEFGMPTEYYQGLPIVVISNDAEDKPILGFDEVAPVPHATTHDCTSIYVVSFTEGGLNGIENMGFQVTDLGLQGPIYQTMLEWYSSIVLFSGKSAARLQGVKAANITA